MQMSVPANPPTVHYVLKVSSQLHANVRSSSATIRHAAAKKTQISGFSSFLTWVVKSTACVFITSHRTDRFAFRQNQRRKHVDSWAVAVHKQRLEAPGVTLRQAENVRRRASMERHLAGQSGNPASCEGKRRRGLWVCGGLLHVPVKYHPRRSHKKRKKKSQLETEVIAYILAGWLFMYSTCHEF